jgi:hypothetical protein
MTSALLEPLSPLSPLSPLDDFFEFEVEYVYVYES